MHIHAYIHVHVYIYIYIFIHIYIWIILNMHVCAYMYIYWGERQIGTGDSWKHKNNHTELYGTLPGLKTSQTPLQHILIYLHWTIAMWVLSWFHACAAVLGLEWAKDNGPSSCSCILPIRQLYGDYTETIRKAWFCLGFPDTLPTTKPTVTHIFTHASTHGSPSRGPAYTDIAYILMHMYIYIYIYI